MEADCANSFRVAPGLPGPVMAAGCTTIAANVENRTHVLHREDSSRGRLRHPCAVRRCEQRSFLRRFRDLLLAAGQHTQGRSTRRNLWMDRPSRSPMSLNRAFRSFPKATCYRPDNRWLTMPLKDAGTTNIWGFPPMGSAQTVHRFRTTADPDRQAGFVGPRR